MRQAKEDELVDRRIRSMDNSVSFAERQIYSVDSSVSMDDKSAMKKNPFLASAKLVAILGGVVFMMSGCVGNMPSTLEVAATLSKKAYNKCSTLDNWQCLWDNESSR